MVVVGKNRHLTELDARVHLEGPAEDAKDRGVGGCRGLEQMPPLKGAAGDLDDERSAVDGVMSKRARHLPDSSKRSTNLTHSPPGQYLSFIFTRIRHSEIARRRYITARWRRRGEENAAGGRW